jgi:hypothetical protein
MNAFRVWVRPLGGAYRVRVDGAENARWLLERLSQSFVFKNTDALAEERDSPFCTFQVPCQSRLSRSAFERLLAAIPEVQLALEPA